MSTQNLENFSFKKYAWNQFKKDKVALVCLYLLFLLIVIAVFAPVIANDRFYMQNIKDIHYTLHFQMKVEQIPFLPMMEN